LGALFFFSPWFPAPVLPRGWVLLWNVVSLFRRRAAPLLLRLGAEGLIFRLCSHVIFFLFIDHSSVPSWCS
jgi:hypothetical protein